MNVSESIEMLSSLRQWSPATILWYTEALASVSDLEITSLTPAVVEERLLALPQNKWRDFLRFLRIICNWAVERGDLKENPVRCQPPRKNRAPVHCWMDTKSCRKYLVAADEVKNGLVCQIALVTGLRRGELMGLHLEDYEHPSIRVVRSLKRHKGEWITTDGKSTSSHRSVVVPGNYALALDQHVQRKTEGPYIFSQPNGEPFAQWNLQRIHRRVLKKAKLPDMRFHDLRHSHAVMCLENGVPMKAIQTRLGHSSYQITADTYSHVSESYAKTVAEKLEEIL